MTPLAQKFARELTLPKKDRGLRDESGLLKRIGEFMCFELSEVRRPIAETAQLYADTHQSNAELAFLPAPLTWLEWKQLSGERMAYLLEKMEGQDSAHVWGCYENGFWHVGALELRASIEWQAAHRQTIIKHPAVEIRYETWCKVCWHIYGALTLINMPRLIGRRTHLPHAGLQRKLARSKGLIGKFPLRAWTEIKLEVAAIEADDAGSVETRLTGEKAYHRVKAYFKPSLGREIADHWRGNPALGIVRSRYSVVPPRDGSPPEIHP